MSTVTVSNGASRQSDVFTGSVAPTGHDIDTVHLRLDGSFGPDLLQGFDDYSECVGDVGWLWSKAQCRNLRLMVTPSALRIRGSMAVFVSGTNAAPFEHLALLPALADLARDLGLSDLLLARVMRLDTGVNVPWQGPIEEVVGALTAVPPVRLVPFRPASAAVSLTTRQLAIYDKRAERGQRPVDPSYGDGSLMRVELRYIKDVDRQLGRPVTLGLLCARTFYGELGGRLVAEAEGVQFQRTGRFPGAEVPTDRRDAYAALGIAANGGVEAAYSAVEVDRQSGHLGDGTKATRQAYAHRRMIDRIWTQSGAAEEINIGPAFREAVQRAVRNQH